MEKVILTLLEQLAQEREALRARGLMIDILAEAVDRLRGAGFAPVLELAGCEALVVLRLDTGAWVLRQAAPFVAVDEPVPVVKDSLIAAPTAVPVAAAPAVRPKPVAKMPPRSAPTATWWTPERDALILQRRGEGKSATEIAAEIGSTEKAVWNRTSKLRKRGREVPEVVRATHRPFATPSVRADGVVLRAWTDADDAQLIAAYTSGSTLADVAKTMRRSLSALTKRITTLRNEGRIAVYRGIVPLDKKWSDARHAELRRLWPIMPVAQIAQQMGISTGAVSGMAHRKGLGPAFRGVANAQTVAAVVDEQKSEPVGVPEVAAQPAPDALPDEVPEVAPRFVPKVGGNLTPAAARPVLAQRAPARMFPGITQGEKEALIAAHVAALPVHAEFDAELDLELCEAVFGGKGGLALFATDMGVDQRHALARFDAIVAPFRQGGSKALPIEAAGLILPALRARVKAARGVAA